MITPEELRKLAKAYSDLYNNPAEYGTSLEGDRCSTALEKAADEIERLRTVLAWYADEDNYCESGFGYERAWSDAQSDKGYRATEALGDK